eukprot:scaffold1397_cov254-Pinguiococcus_pyrenoidosus.AAC.20
MDLAGRASKAAWHDEPAQDPGTAVWNVRQRVRDLLRPHAVIPPSRARVESGQDGCCFLGVSS